MWLKHEDQATDNATLEARGKALYRTRPVHYRSPFLNPVAIAGRTSHLDARTEQRLTGEDAAVEDVERHDGAAGLGAGGDEARVVVDAEVMLEPHHRRAPVAHGAAGDDEALAAERRGGEEAVVAEAEREECHGTRAAAAAIGGRGAGIRRAGLARAHGEVVAEDGARAVGGRDLCVWWPGRVLLSVAAVLPSSRAVGPLSTATQRRGDAGRESGTHRTAPRPVRTP